MWRLHPQHDTELGSPLAQLYAGDRRSHVGCQEGADPCSSTLRWPCPEGLLSLDSQEIGPSLAWSLSLLVPRAAQSIHLGTDAAAACGKATLAQHACKLLSEKESEGG